MKSFLVWIPAIVIYGLFLGWHQNWGGPLSAVEISNIMQRLEASEVGASGRNEIETMRKFLEADDGREFYMLNLVRVDPAIHLGRQIWLQILKFHSESFQNLASSHLEMTWSQYTSRYLVTSGK